jgi:hypothetical protein
MVHYIGSGQIVVMVICNGHGLGVLAKMGIQLHKEMYWLGNVASLDDNKPGEMGSTRVAHTT